MEHLQQWRVEGMFCMGKLYLRWLHRLMFSGFCFKLLGHDFVGSVLIPCLFFAS